MCSGGRSFGCKHEEHPLSKRIPNIRCQHCGERMGCNWCVQIPQELICLNCHDWAHWKGLRQHGKMIPRAEAEKAMDGLMNEIPFRLRGAVYRPIISEKRQREPGDDDE